MPQRSVRADDHVGGGELLAHEVRAFADGVGQHVHHRVEIAIAEHGARAAPPCAERHGR